jgi:4-aminobutyrate aminotransferase-like enzyme
MMLPLGTADKDSEFRLRTGFASTTIGTGGCKPMGETLVASGASAIREYSVEEPLKHLMQELGNAINDSLSESDRIAEAIGDIKRAGYDVFLVLEATIGFNRRNEDSEEEEEQLDAMETPKRSFETTGKIKFTSQDHRFLRALKIAVDEENR